MNRAAMRQRLDNIASAMFFAEGHVFPSPIIKKLDTWEERMKAAARFHVAMEKIEADQGKKMVDLNEVLEALRQEDHFGSELVDAGGAADFLERKFGGK